MRKAFELLKTSNAHIPWISNTGLEFCHMKIGNLWKIHYFDGTNWKRLKVPQIPDDCTECQVSSFEQNGRIFVSFIAGYSRICREFDKLQLVWFSGNDINYLKLAGKIKAISGCLLPDGNITYATINKISMFGRNYRSSHYPFPFRMCYDPLNPYITLITMGNGSDFESLVATKNQLFKITYDENCCYKMCCYKNEIYFATKNEDDRRIVEIEDLSKLKM